MKTPEQRFSEEFGYWPSEVDMRYWWLREYLQAERDVQENPSEEGPLL